MKKVIVIGGGPAGMIAAGMAASRGYEVHLFEKNNKLGKKLYITGKGRCNLTNAGEIQELIEHIPGNANFLYSAFYTFTNQDTVDFFHQLGVPTKIERGNRVFPISDYAGDVVEALRGFLDQNGVQIHYNALVEKVYIQNGQAIGIKIGNIPNFHGDAVIVATGGLSYPTTGCTGDGYKFAREAGHTVKPLNPALVPLLIKEVWIQDLQGLSLKNIGITIKDAKKKAIYKDFGEMLFTHYGVSGPIILSASRHLLNNPSDIFMLHIDLKPALDAKVLDQRILRDFEKYHRKHFKNALDELLPQKLIPIIIQLSEIDPDKKVYEVTKEERKRLINLIKNLTCTITGTRGFKEAVITVGGVAVDEVNPATMESKMVQDLYFVGEVLDVDGYTGGFNLQIAFSTGYIAGMNV